MEVLQLKHLVFMFKPCNFFKCDKLMNYTWYFSLEVMNLNKYFVGFWLNNIYMHDKDYLVRIRSTFPNVYLKTGFFFKQKFRSVFLDSKLLK